MSELAKKFRWGALVLVIAAGGLYLLENRTAALSSFFVEQKPSSLKEETPLRETPKSAASPATGTGATGTGDTPAAPPAASSPPVPREIRTGTFSFGDFVELRGKIEEARLDVQLFELRRKMEKPPPVVAPQPAPARPDFVLPALPSLAPAPKPMPKPAMPEAVVGVQGVDGDLSAVIRTSAGRHVTVKPGDRFGGGVVSAVSRSGVVVRRGNTSSTITFSEISE
jgi:type IV pilus biogenesis protein PilP